MMSAYLPDSGNTSSLRARSLYLEFPFFDLGLPIVKALLHILHFPSLQSLTIACFAMSQAATAGRLISRVGEHLLHFTLDLRTLFSAGPYGMSLYALYRVSAPLLIRSIFVMQKEEAGKTSRSRRVHRYVPSRSVSPSHAVTVTSNTGNKSGTPRSAFWPLPL